MYTFNVTLSIQRNFLRFSNEPMSEQILIFVIHEKMEKRNLALQEYSQSTRSVFTLIHFQLLFWT